MARTSPSARPPSLAPVTIIRDLARGGARWNAVRVLWKYEHARSRDQPDCDGEMPGLSRLSDRGQLDVACQGRGSHRDASAANRVEPSHGLPRGEALLAAQR